jgi:serine/threonine protein kinase
MKYCDRCPSGYPDYAVTCPVHGGALHEIRELKSGMVIHKAYRIVRKLGQGGMGIVYLADHLYMQEQRALKFLSWELCQDEAFTSRFRQEVRTLQRIHHRNVVDCGDLEPAEDDSLFFPMEFVDGPDLWDFLRASPILLDMELALSLSIAITEGLSAAHALGLVHRDIKPENILLASSGEEWIPKIADFGIVAIKESGNTRTRTKTGASLLTMEYAAPEQWRGMRAGELDGRTDIYALGGVLFEMLTGKSTFEAESYEGWAECHKNQTPRRPSELRPEVAEWPGMDELVLQMLSKDREQRPSSTVEVLRRLKEIQHVAPADSPTGWSASRKDTVIEVPPFVADPTPVNTPLKSSTAPREPLAPPPPLSFGTGSGDGIAGAGEFRGLPQQNIQITPHDLGLIGTGNGAASRTTTGGNAAAQKPGKWLPFALAAMVLFATGGVIYYVHASKQPVQQATRYVPSTPEAQDTPAPRPSPVVVPKPMVLPETKPPAPASNTQVETIAEKVSRGQTLYKAKRYSEAAPLFEAGCSGGNSLACNQLGYLYEEGLGVPKTPTRAVTLYTKGCDLNNEVACFNLGGMYSQGIGIKQDYPKAVSLYSKSCDAGDATACNSLGVMYQAAHGVAQDNAKAATLFSKACTAGEAAACSNLGQAYIDGEGVPKDADKGKEFLTKGCSMGDQWGCDKLKPKS